MHSGQSFSLLARIPTEQYEATGAYADSVIVSVTY
jgi:spore coat protein U-like protein